MKVKIGKKLIALFLGIVMVMSLLPMTAFAEGESDALPVCICETTCTADNMNAVCPICGAEGALPEQCGYSAAPETAENEQVLYVQSLIDALPNVDMITEDNADAVMDQLEGIDAAKMNLTDAELETLDFSRYIAVVSALNALTSDEIVPMAAEDTSATITYEPEIKWQRTKELVYSETGLEGLYAGAVTDYETVTSSISSGTRTYTAEYTWDFDTISTALDRTDDEQSNVWDYGKDAQYANSQETTNETSIVPQDGVFAATWNNRSYKAKSVSGTYYAKGQFDSGSAQSYTVRKFSGTFIWPEGYDLTSNISILSKNDANYQAIYDYINGSDELKAAFGGKKVIAVNDDMYVFIYKDGDILTADNYNNYLAFWTGTAGKGVWASENNDPQAGNWNNYTWKQTSPATYGNEYAIRAFKGVVPNMDTATLARGVTRETLDTLSNGLLAKMNHSNGWYSFADGNAVSTVLNNQYKDNVNAGDTFHIDIYCIDVDKVGGMDELELVLTKAAPTQANVTVRYWLNAVGTDPTNNNNFLGSTIMTNQEIGSSITLSGGTAVNQLNYKKADAIAKNNNRDVADGEQMNTIIVKANSDENIINVLYVPADQKIVHLHAGNAEALYDGNEHTVKDVTIKESGYTDIVVPDSVTTTSHELNDGSEWDKNTVANITAQRTEILPGIYDVNFTAESFVKNSNDQALSNYTVIRHPGKLTITYTPSSEVCTYDFGVTNSYDVLKDVEKQAVSITAPVDYVTVENGVVLYTPQSVNKGETITLTLTYAGGYTCDKEISFYPATNVLYEENFMANDGTNGNWMLESGNADTVVNDNSTTVYGYAEAYESFNGLSNGGALKATLNLNGARRVFTSDAVTFTFTGTGFDLISECGTNTGMLVAGVKNAETGKAVKAFVVDTYFCGDGEIISDSGILDYQVPVIRSMGLPYGTYTVSVYGYLSDASGASVSTQSFNTQAMAISTQSFNTQAMANSAVDAGTILSDLGMSEYLDADISVSFMDDNSVLNGGTGAVVDKPETSGAWNWLKGLFSNRAAVQSASDNGDINVYLDAFRVYQPLEDENIYVGTEQGLKYGSFYDYVVGSAQDFEDNLDGSMVYMEYDGEQNIAVIKEYKKQGPQNEIYLSAGNYVGFVLNGYTGSETVMVSAKAVQEGAQLWAMPDYTNEPISENLSAAEMYYDVTSFVSEDNELGYVLILGNSGEGLLALSGIKLATNVTPGESDDLASLIKYDKGSDVFNPDTFDVKYTANVKLGKKTALNVKTSLDVDHIAVYYDAELTNVVDGKDEVKPSNQKAVANGKAKLYSYSVSVKIEETENIFYVVAYDSNGNASNPVAVTIKGN